MRALTSSRSSDSGGFQEMSAAARTAVKKELRAEGKSVTNHNTDVHLSASWKELPQYIRDAYNNAYNERQQQHRRVYTQYTQTVSDVALLLQHRSDLQQSLASAPQVLFVHLMCVYLTIACQQPTARLPVASMRPGPSSSGQLRENSAVPPPPQAAAAQASLKRPSDSSFTQSPQVSHKEPRLSEQPYPSAPSSQGQTFTQQQRPYYHS